jgi:formylglycine-generating enzyme required for sulfatase activity
MDSFEVDYTTELEADSLDELAGNLDSKWEIGKKLLYSGMLERKLYGLGEEELFRKARELRDSVSDQNAGLELFLQATGKIPPPTITVTPESFIIETYENSLTVKVAIENGGRGYLIGEICSDAEWAHPSMAKFSSNRLSVAVDLDLTMIPRETTAKAAIAVKCGSASSAVNITIHRRGLPMALTLYDEGKYQKVIQVCEAILRESPFQSDAIFLQSLSNFKEGNINEAFDSLFLIKSLPETLPVMLTKDLFAELTDDEVFYPYLNRVISFYEQLLPSLSYDYRTMVEYELAASYLKKAVILWDKIYGRKDVTPVLTASLARQFELSTLFHRLVFPVLRVPLSPILRLFSVQLTEDGFLRRLGGPVYLIGTLVSKSRMLQPENIDLVKFTKKQREEERELIKRSAHTLALELAMSVLLIFLIVGYRFQRSTDFYEQGRKALREGRYEEAVSCFEKSMEAGYKYTLCILSLSEAHQKWAQDFLRKRDYFSAVEHYNLSLRYNPVNAGVLKEKLDAVMEWAISLMGRGNFRDAYIKFNLLLSIDRENVKALRLKEKALYLWVRGLIDDRRYPEAMEVLVIIERDFRENSKAAELRVVVLSAWGQYLFGQARMDEALEKWEEAHRLAPTDSETLRLLGMYRCYRGMRLIPGRGIWKLDEFDPRKRYYVEVPSFYMDRFEVTNQQFERFVRETGYLTEYERKTAREASKGAKSEDEEKKVTWRSWSGPGREQYPVICVSVEDALSYARWAKKKLPSKLQRGCAADFSPRRPYPWGDAFDRLRCNSGLMDSISLRKSMILISAERGTLPVGSFPSGESPYGISDMSGNAGEWTFGEGDLNGRSVRKWSLAGGSWASRKSEDLRTDAFTQAGGQDGALQKEGIAEPLVSGFRCVKDTP